MLFRRFYHRSIQTIVVASAGLTSLAAAARPSVDDFARTPIINRMRLSPDGQSIAFLREYAAVNYLCVLDLNDDRITRFKVGHASYRGSNVPKEVQYYAWISDQRLVITTTVWDMLWGAAAIDRDGKNWQGLTGLEFDHTGRTSSPAFETIHAFRDNSQRILMLDLRSATGTARLHPDVLEVNTATGDSKVVQKNPGNVVSWMSDHEGAIRIGIARDEHTSAVLYRDEIEDPWRTLPLPGRGHEKLRPLGFDPHNGSFYVAGFNDEDRWSVFPFDLNDGSLGEALVSDPVYDTLGGGFVPRFAGQPLTRPLFSESKQALIGFTYVTESPRTKWLDATFATIQGAVDQALPHTINQLVNQSADDSRLLFLSFSDRDPGTFHLLDRTAKSFKPIGSRMDWIDPRAMSPVYPIHYDARDGQSIQGYLTVPVGHEPKNLPIVLLPHGGPWVRDVWAFDPLVQLLASRGYAVLQMNYRGSRGYGSAFDMLGIKQVGRGIQTDIEDAARWAITSGLADPQRLAIVGASYGGYSALFGLGRSPGLYRCGISINGVTDWAAMFSRTNKDPLLRSARAVWRTKIGDPEEDDNFLKSISPVHFAADITAPVLIIQGREDSNVPLSQARSMAAALKQSGRPAQTLYLKDTGHSLSLERTRREAFNAMVEFLEKHLGPGVEYRPQT